MLAGITITLISPVRSAGGSVTHPAFMCRGDDANPLRDTSHESAR